MRADFRAQIVQQVGLADVFLLAVRRVSYRMRRSMVVLRCTRRLLARLKRADNLSDDESTTRLGDWYGNVLPLGHRLYLLFISERSRLPVVIPIREARHLATVFPTLCVPSLLLWAFPPCTSPMNARGCRRWP